MSKPSLNCDIVRAKSEMNVLIPTEGDDFDEFPVPEQFKALWNGQKLVNTVPEIAGKVKYQWVLCPPPSHMRQICTEKVLFLYFPFFSALKLLLCPERLSHCLH